MLKLIIRAGETQIIDYRGIDLIGEGILKVTDLSCSVGVGELPRLYLTVIPDEIDIQIDESLTEVDFNEYTERHDGAGSSSDN